MRLIRQLKQPDSIHPAKDILSGIIVALVSIPISMGYAQIAGLPVVYGLYGSLLPILVFAFLTTSPQFVVGVDAMPAAMVGGLLAQIGIAAESQEAMSLVPCMAIITAGWFIVFWLLKAGRIVKYISTPVMSGFISGVGLTIILMQIPKLFGGTPGTGELPALLIHIKEQLPQFHLLSFCLGLGTVIIIQVCKKLIPKVPMTAVMLLAGAALQAIFHLDQYGVKMLPEVSGGLPKLVLPDFSAALENFPDVAVQTFSIAAVIMAQSLLATDSYAMKHGDMVDNSTELLAYAGMNLAGGLVGCCPINGSVSRSGIADSMGCRSQIMSVSAAGSMLIVLLFGTPLLKYLPVPVLTGIVMTALIGILDINMARRLWKTSRNELIIFLLSFLGVLLFGTVYGVLIGIALSFADVALQSVHPVAGFMGRIPGQGNFYSLERNSRARPIRSTVIYRFNGSLFFANIDKFQADIEGAIRPDTHTVVVDARGIDSVDITAADRLVMLSRSLHTKGIRFYLTEHHGSLNDRLRLLGAGELMENGSVRRTISLALADSGLTKPYELEGAEEENPSDEPDISDEALAEFEWAFGSEADHYLALMAERAAQQMLSESAPGQELNDHWNCLTLTDEDEFLEMLELTLENVPNAATSDAPTDAELIQLEERIENRRERLNERIDKLPPKARERVTAHRERFENHLRQEHPEEVERIRRLRETVQIRENK